MSEKPEVHESAPPVVEGIDLSIYVAMATFWRPAAFSRTAELCVKNIGELKHCVGILRYEPAVPKCKTCRHFKLLVSESVAFCVLLAPQAPRFVRWDGSGFCADHEVLK
jgi:hypothetical protein